MKILIIDDNQTIRENISLYLTSKGYITKTAPDGEVAIDLILAESYDFLIIDRLMPRIDGLSLVRMLAAKSLRIPFLFLTALSKQSDKIEWLSLGADDYLVKPFDLEELTLRIENILKRNGKIIPVSQNVYFDTIEVNLRSQSVKKDGKRIDLSPKEYALLELLIQERGKVLDRDFIYETIWGDYDASEKTLETINVHISYLRKKLWGNFIRTVKLAGYIID